LSDEAFEDGPDPAMQYRVAETILGHSFSRPALLHEALTHRSAAHGRRGQHRRGERRGVGSNERLEFIGDRVLALIMAEWLIERFPDEQEGELGPRHAHLVSRKVLAMIAETAGLSDALAIAPSEARAGVGQLANVLADAMEAMIGALYLDAGLDAAQRFVRTAWQSAMDALLLPPKDPKTALQEWLMARGLPLPIYRVTGRSGPSHAPEFVITVTACGETGTGRAGAKRLAERLAAAELLERLRP
jgi:ribonuclease-3